MKKVFIDAIIACGSITKGQVIDAVYDGFGGYNLIKNGQRIGFIDYRQEDLFEMVGLTCKVKIITTINQHAKTEFILSRVSKASYFIRSLLNYIKRDKQNSYEYKMEKIPQSYNINAICDELIDKKMLNRLSRYYERT